MAKCFENFQIFSSSFEQCQGDIVSHLYLTHSMSYKKRLMRNGSRTTLRNFFDIQKRNGHEIYVELFSYYQGYLFTKVL